MDGVGSLADWVAAVAAVTALGAAIWAGLASWRLFQTELGRDERAAELRRRGQAAGIAAWVVTQGKGHKRGLLLHNSSDAPVFDVVVEAVRSWKSDHEGVPEKPLVLTILPPGDYIALEDPDYAWTYPKPAGLETPRANPVMKNPQWRVTRVRFRDAQGVRWMREDGQLVEDAAGKA